MSYPNPYAAPQVANPYADSFTPPAKGFPGLWRQGNVLVLHKLAPLPDICVKSNLPANRRLRRNMNWHPPAIFLALLINLIVYVIIAMIMQKKATIHIPLTEEWFARRKTRMAIAWSLVLVSAATLVLGIVLVVNEYEWAVLLFVVGLLGGLGAAIYGLVASRLVAPTRITDEYVWLKGVHPEYLDRLQVWPYNI